MSFTGFTDEGRAFLADLPHRDPDWFKANKARYQELVAEPAKAFVHDLGEAMRPAVPDLVAEPRTNGSIAPINNDLRFSPDKAPYKDHLLFRFWEGSPKKAAPTLFVRMSPTDVGFAAGVVPADVGAWRQAIDGPAGARIAAAVEALTAAQKAEVVGQELKRVPAPYAPDHPRADLLRHKMLQVRWVEPLPASAARPAFVDWCARRLERAVPLHRALVEADA